MVAVPTLTDIRSDPACCAPLTQEPLTAERAVVLAAQLKALADPARLRLISLLAASATGEVCVCDLTAPVGLTQPTVSHHLRVLREAGLVDSEKRGTWVYYRVVPQAFRAVADLLNPGRPA